MMFLKSPSNIILIIVSSLCLLLFTNATTTTTNIRRNVAADTDTIVEPDLPFGDINVVVVTDVHSFVGGHRHDPNANANYGDVLSFVEHLKSYAQSQSKDLWFVMNGDWMHGTGLAMDGNAEHLMPILNKMPFDAVTLGNHESYSSAIVKLMQDTMIPNLHGHYITSNVNEVSTGESFGDRYTILQGINHRLLVFGFIYNHCEPSSLLHVKRVKDVIEQEWFTTVLTEEQYDAILVLAHMDYDDKYVTQIVEKIREVTGSHTIVQFVAGHTHIRAEKKIDHHSHSFEAGAFLDTIGFVSFPTITGAEAVPNGAERHKLFQNRFLDGSVENLTATLQIEPPGTFSTPNGTSLTQLIQDTQNDLGLTETVACPPHDYYRDVSIHGHDSIFDLWRQVAKQQILKRDPWSVMMISKDALRHDIRGTLGSMELDDVVAIAPFMEPVLYLGKIPSWVIRRANSTLNTYSLHAKVPDFVLVGDIEADGDYDFYTQVYSLNDILEAFDRLNQKDLQPAHTGERDTLYWLEYLEKTFPCGEQATHIDPWFKNIHKLNEELGDSYWGQENSLDADTDDVVMPDSGSSTNDNNNNNNNNNQNNDHQGGGGGNNQGGGGGEGYQGYLPPSTIDQYHDALPPGTAPTTGTKVVGSPPTNQNTHPMLTKEELEERQEKKKHLRKMIIKILALIVGVLMLVVPIYGGIQSIRNRNESVWDEDDGLVYDREEVRSLRQKSPTRPPRRDRRKNKKNRQQPRLRPSEMELT